MLRKRGTLITGTRPEFRHNMSGGAKVKDPDKMIIERFNHYKNEDINSLDDLQNISSNTWNVGIGRAIAKKLVECGAETIALTRTQADLETLKQEVPSIQTVQCDLSDWDITRKTVEEIGHVDLLVNNAGVLFFLDFLDVTKEALYKTFDVNFFAVYNVTQVIAKRMVEKNKGGSIVNISSIAGRMATPGSAIYGPTKGALDCLARQLSMEFGKYQIRVNTVQPTVVNTNMTRDFFKAESENFLEAILARHPTGRVPVVDDVANAVLFLLSEKADTITGVNLPVDSGIMANAFMKTN